MTEVLHIVNQSTGGDGPEIMHLSGPLTIRTLSQVENSIAQAAKCQHCEIDLAQVTRLDTAGAWLLCVTEQRVKADGGTFVLRNASDSAQLLLQNVRKLLPKGTQAQPRPPALRALLDRTGRNVVAGVSFLAGLAGYLGLFLHRMGGIIRRPSRLRVTALFAHAEDVGLRAVPIVALMAFLIGVVLAFQGSAQLQQFGAEVFVVDLIAISILRELGILLTAIIVAGRTASAFTAAIGSMKMREEIDAMQTLGLDPATVLFVPRILALLFMLPVLGLIANLMGLIGGGLMAWIDLGISPSMFRARLLEGTDIAHVFVGMIKAPFFALIIGVVGCYAGMQVRGNAESLGRMTSNAVVTAIFAVIVADALFSIFFAQIGI